MFLDNYDLGKGHKWVWAFGSWHTYQTLFPEFTVTEEDGQKHVLIGGVIMHKNRINKDKCAGSVYFVRPINATEHEMCHPIFTMTSVFPLTITESFFCDCGDCGAITDGLWKDSRFPFKV